MKSKVIETFLNFIEIDSISKEERQIADILTKKLSEMGLEVYEDDAGKKINGNAGNIIGKLKGDKNIPSLLFMAHMDTVTPGKGKIAVIENEYIKSKGDTILGADDLSGIAIILTATENIIASEISHGDIYIIFTVAEESGLLGAKNLNTEGMNINYGFILDSSGDVGTVCLKAPSQYNMDVTITGKAAHAGMEPEKGINAIVVASDAISKMNTGRIDYETTANIGIINGGRATNIVCEEVTVKCEVRSHNAEKLNKQIEHMKGCFENSTKKYKAKLDLKVEREYVSFNIEKEDKIVQIATRAAKEIGRELITIASGGGSDTNILNEKGIKVINIGIGMENVHSKDEKIKIEELEKGTAYLESIIKIISNQII